MFQPVQSKKLHQQVFEQIQNLIAEGELKPGDRLPSERDLGEMLQVSRNSIREAIRALEALGIIESRHGGGNYITSDISSGMLEPLSLTFRLHGGTFTDLLEVRRALENEAAVLAAGRITRPQKTALKKLMEQFRQCADEEASVRADKELHLKIAEYSGNVLLRTFLTAISSLLERAIKDGRQGIIRAFKDHEQLADMHDAICQAVIGGDAKAAGKAVDHHFKMIIDNLSER